MQKLNDIYSNIASCRVVVEMPHNHNSQGNQYSVYAILGMHSNDILINQDHHEDIYIALRDAFAAAKR